jgi:hypothetical protein
MSARRDRKEPAMDWSSEKYPWLYLLLGFALVFAWGVISLAHAYERSLARVNDSFTRGSMIMEQLGAVRDDLARLSVDQQAFLSTGDAIFQDGVIESIEALTLHIGILNSLAARSKLQAPALAALSRSIDQVLGSVGESDEIVARRGRAAAIAFFESREPTILEAGADAEHLRTRIAATISDRIQNAQSTAAFLHDL